MQGPEGCRVRAGCGNRGPPMVAALTGSVLDSLGASREQREAIPDTGHPFLSSLRHPITNRTCARPVLAVG